MMYETKVKEYIPGTLNGVAGIGIVLISFLVDIRLQMAWNIAKPSGIILVIIGMSLVIWAAVYIKGAFLGEVEPRLERLICEGPYRVVRHPIYLGMSIALLGVTVSLRSWPGMIGVFLLFLPSEIYRAILEEKALAAKFGSVWERYATRTPFMLPFLGGKV